MSGAEDHRAPFDMHVATGENLPSSSFDPEGTFSECDVLLKNIDSLIADINRGPLSPSLAKLNPMHTWNDKRRSTSFLGRAASLASNITEIEAKMRHIISDSAEKKEKMKREGTLLKREICDCHAYIETLCVKMEVLAENMRIVIDAVTRETEEVKEMVTFNKEIIRQDQLEKAASAAGGYQGRWSAASRGRISRQLTMKKEQDALESDVHHMGHLEKLVSLRVLRDRLVSGLGPVLELKESYLSTQSLLEDTLEDLNEYATGDKITPTSPLGGRGGSRNSAVVSMQKRHQAREIDQHELLALFNGLNKRATTCVEALASTKDDVHHAHSRLQSLVEGREVLSSLCDSLGSCGGGSGGGQPGDNQV